MYTIKSGSTIVYDQNRPGQWPIIAPRISQELNQAGEFQFLLIPNGNSFYDTCEPLATYLSVEDDGDEVFYGRVLTRSDPIFKGQVTITCEGALSFLTDVQLPPDEKVDGKQVYQTQTAEAFFRRCIEAYNRGITHNGQIDARRQLSVGTVSHPKSTEQKEYRITSYVDIRNAIENQLLDEYGGYIRIRKSGRGHVIDWLDAYHDVDPQPITVGENVIDQTNKITGENIFTVLLPVGKDGLTLKAGDGEWVNDDGTVRVFYNSDIVGKYGKIVRTIQFSDQDTAAGLYSKTAEYINKLNYTLYRDAEIKLVDFHYINGSYPKLRLGSAYTHVEGFNEPMALASLEIALENPADGTLTLKNAKELESEFSGLGGNSSANSNSRSLSGGIGGSYGPQFKYIHEFDERLQLATKDISINAERLTLTSNELISLSRKTLGEEADVELEDSILGMVRKIQGTGIFQDSDKITELAGKWTIDEDTGNLILNEGSELVVSDRNGTTITVGENLGTIKTMVDGHETFINDFKGSTLWTQKDNITGFVGNFDVETDKNGKKKLVIKDGAGLVIRDGETEHGVYTDGNLDAGVIISKLNRDGGASSTIRGDLINLSGNDEFSTIQSNVTTSKGWIETHGGPAVEALEGTQILQNANKIIDTVGEFEVTYGADGKPTGVYVVNGSTFQLRRDNTLWGIYDEGNLTGGIIINKVNSVDGTQTGMKIKADVLDIKVPEINLDGTEIINVINENDTLQINAGKVNLSGYLQASGLQAAIARLNSLTVNGTITANGGTVRANDFVYGNNESLLDAFVNVVKDEEGSLVKLTFKRAGGRQGDSVVTFNRASTPTLVAKWKTTTRFEVSAGEATAGTSIDGWERVGVEASGKALKVRYRVLFDEYTSGGGTDYKNVYEIYDENANASAVYDNGWRAAARAVQPPTSANTTTDNFSIAIPSVLNVDKNDTPLKYTVKINNTAAYVINSAGTIVCRLEHTKYNDGWIAAAKAVQPPTSANTTTDNFSIAVPSTTTPGSNGTPLTYTVKINNTAAYVINSAGTIVCRLEHTKYEEGWMAAAKKVKPPTEANTTTDNFSIAVPSTATINADGTPLTYTVKINNTAAYVQNSAGTIVCRLGHTKYADGWKAAAAKILPPTMANTSTDNFSIAVPHATTPDTNGTALKYTVKINNTAAYVINSAGTIVCRLAHSLLDPTQLTVSQFYGTTEADAKANGYTKTTSDITQSTSVAYYAFNVSNKKNFYFKVTSTAVEPTVTLRKSWNETSGIVSSRTLTVTASGLKSNPSTTQTIHLTVGVWEDGFIPIYIKDTSTNGSVLAENSVSLPAVTNTTWTNTTGNTWRADLTIGGVTRSSTTKDFTPTNDKITVSQFYGTTEASAKQSGFVRTPTDITLSSTTGWYAFAVMNKKNFYFKVTSTASDTTTITVSQFYGTTEASAKQSGFVRTPTDIVQTTAIGWYAFAVNDRKNFYFKVTADGSSSTTKTYEQGWRAAANKVVPPTNANTETDTFSIEVPSKTTVDANGTALKYTIKLNKMAAYVINNAGTIVCRLANDTYNQGWSDYYHDSGNFMKSWACTSSTTDSTGYSCTAGKHYCTRPTSTPGGWQVWFCWEDEMESYVPETPKASGLSIGSISYVSGSGYSNWVSGKGNVTDLGRVTTLAKQNSQGYVVFRITHSGMTGAKWCRVPTVN